MNPDSVSNLTATFAKGLVDDGYLRQGAEAQRRREKLVKHLLQHKRMPDQGWDSATIRWWLGELALMDSNNFLGNVGAGEREARVVCDLVRDRHFGLGHGIGRSGDIGATQPKAAGSSVISRITRCMVRDLVQRVVGMPNLKGFLVVPMATGMSILLVLSAMKLQKPNAKYVIWPRIDQKTCFKAISSAGLHPVVVDNVLEDGHTVKTDLQAVEREILSLGPENVLCVLSTTSCFAPRVPDDVEALARIAANHDVGHVINNAYGLQCSKIAHQINQACRLGRVDAVVQSSDKNLMVPVGGAIIAGPNVDFIETTVSKTYPGRASMAPILDIFMTLLSVGADGFKQFYANRKRLSNIFREKLAKLAEKHGEKLILTKGNTISFALTLDNVQRIAAKTNGSVAEFGSKVFTRGISGARVVPRGVTNKVAGVEFHGYGASISDYPHAYATFACSVGLEDAEFEVLLKKLDQLLGKYPQQA